MRPTLQSFLDAAEENFRSQKLEEAIKQAKLARDYIDQVLITYDVHMASQRKINGDYDWYAVLGILDCTADKKAIKNAYMKRVLKLHPDKNSSAAAIDAFQLVLNAWEVLSKPSSRQDYDLKRGSTPPWKQHEYEDQQDETAPKSSKGPTSTSEQVSPSHCQSSPPGTSGFGAGATENYGSSASQDQAQSSNSAAMGSANSSGGWPTNYNQPPFPFPFPGPWSSGFYNSNPFPFPFPWPPIYGGASGWSGTANTSNQAPPPNNTPTAGSWRRSLVKGSWAESMCNKYQHQYGQNPSNFGAARGTWNTGASASSSTTQVPLPVSALLTGLCPSCKTQLTSTPDGTKLAISCRYCNLSFCY
ncbi:hypothetical protein REPUB_Repub18cG0121500 [Reevesia pubescens]